MQDATARPMGITLEKEPPFASDRVHPFRTVRAGFMHQPTEPLTTERLENVCLDL